VPEVKETEKKRRSREEIAERIEAFEKAHQHNPSERQLAEELGIPRSTLQHWLKRKDSIEAEPEVVAFFESSVGSGRPLGDDTGRTVWHPSGVSVS
jgi:DNA-directed RNA polymerase specialized sigma subunit